MHDDIRERYPAPKNDPPKEEHSFLTPEEAAVKDNAQTVTPSSSELVINMGDEENMHNRTNTSSGSKRSLLSRSSNTKPKKGKFFHLSKKTWLISGGVLIVLLILAGGIVYMAAHHKPTTVTLSTKAPKTAPQKINTSSTVASTLTGLQVAPAANQRPITAVMIENTPQARPQSGLSQAGVVFEALTEGGITRFMALFQDQLPTYVGPVRSARPYFIDWALGFDAPYAHVGGSPQALSEIQTLNVKNMDYLDYPNYFTRISSRPAPHNVYTSIPELNTLESSLGWTSSNFSGWPRKPDAPSAHPTATSINLSLSYSTYNVSYAYDATTNSYDRSEGGAPQIDANTSKQLSPKVVIAMVVPWSQGALDTSDAYYSVYQDIGSGEAYIFQDGTVTIGQWSKTSVNAPLEFTTTSGQPIKLDAGQTWITAVANSGEVSY